MIPEFANKEYFWGFLIIPLLAIWYWKRNIKSTPEIMISFLPGIRDVPLTARVRLRHLPFIVRMLAITLLIIAIARPQSTLNWQDITTEGIDIVICLDISGSMLAEDFHPNRLEACKKIAMEFIDGRPDDRIGLVVFSGESFTQCPMTIDHSVLKNLFSGIKSGIIEDGTAIGNGLATSVNRIKESKAKSKVVILLTDGMNNAGFVAPLTAAEVAKQYNIRVYTIGTGTTGTAPYPFRTPFGTIQYQNVPVEIDEGILKQIAAMTGGKYFRATSNRKLEDIYKEIDRLEKTKMETLYFSKKSELFFPILLTGGGLFLLEILLKLLVFRSKP